MTISLPRQGPWGAESTQKSLLSKVSLANPFLKKVTPKFTRGIFNQSPISVDLCPMPRTKIAPPRKSLWISSLWPKETALTAAPLSKTSSWVLSSVAPPLKKRRSQNHFTKLKSLLIYSRIKELEKWQWMRARQFHQGDWDSRHKPFLRSQSKRVTQALSRRSTNPFKSDTRKKKPVQSLRF